MDLSNVNRLRVFVKVAEVLSFTRAAEELFVTQPAISRAIKELEEAIGAPLFDRIGHGVALTEAGHSLLRYARRVTSLVAEMEAAMEGVSEEVSGDLKLGANTVWEYLLPQVMGDFKKAHAKVYVSMTVASIVQVMTMVRENRVHLGFSVETPQDPELEVVPVLEEELIIVAAPGHPLAAHRTLHASDVQGPLPFVHALTWSGSAHPSRDYLEALGFRPVTVIELDTYESIKRAVRSGIGLGMVSKIAVLEELASGDLVELSLEAPPRKRALIALRNRGRPVSAAQKAFLAHVIAALRPRRV